MKKVNVPTSRRKGVAEALALIDFGATVSIFRSEVAEDLGIEIVIFDEKKKEVRLE